MKNGFGMWYNKPVMSNLLRSTTATAMHIVCEYIKEMKSPVMVDATCGRGHDTLALAKAAIPAGDFRLLAFDIQEEAAASTLELLRAELPEALDGRVQVIQESNANIGRYVDALDVAVFNLGYLPGGDKRITTRSAETAAAVTGAVDMLNVNGIIAVTTYSGHEEGVAEKEALLKLLAELDSRRYHVAFVNLLNQHRNPPETVFVTRKV